MLDDEENTDTTDEQGDDGESGSQEERDSSSTGQSDRGTGAKGDSAEFEALKAQLAAANREAAKYRKERNTAKSELDKLREKDLSDAEREQKRAQQAEERLAKTVSRIQEANLKVALTQSDSKIVDIDTAAMWLNKRGIEFDDEGEPINVSDAIEKLVKEKPFLVGTVGRRTSGGTNGGAGNDDDTTTGGLTADELQMAAMFKMSPEEYAKYKNPE